MATQEIVVRDWLWYVHPMLILFAAIAVFFGFWAFHGLRVLRELGTLKTTQTVGIAKRSLTIRVVLEVVMRVALFFCALFVLWLLIDDTLTGFIHLERTPTTLHLRYHLGLQDTDIPLNAMQATEVRPFGKRNYRLIITTRDGRVMHSVSTDSESLIQDFKQITIQN
jgi:hypothetical protein